MGNFIKSEGTQRKSISTSFMDILYTFFHSIRWVIYFAHSDFWKVFFDPDLHLRRSLVQYSLKEEKGLEITLHSIGVVNSFEEPHFKQYKPGERVFFPHIQEIKSLGVTHYEAYLTDGQTDYHSDSHHTVTVPAKYEPITTADLQTEKILKVHLLAHQQGKNRLSYIYSHVLKRALTNYKFRLDKWPVLITSKPLQRYSLKKYLISNWLRQGHCKLGPSCKINH